MTLKNDSLAFAFLGAANTLAAVESGIALPRALALEFDSADMTPGARGAIQDLSYRSMRAWGSSQALLALLTDKPPPYVRLKTLVCCALTLLAEDNPAYAAHTVVDQAVVAASEDPELYRAKGMVNAVLRRFLRERDSLLAQIVKQETARWNYPQWWIDKTRTCWPDKWQSLLAAGNAQAPLTLRVNKRKTTVSDYLAILAQHGMAATQIESHAVRLTQALPVSRIPFFAEGWVSVQDSAAQLAAPLLDVKDGMRVLDACAAPGGKTGHLLELAELDLIALDQDGQRLERVAQNLKRLQLQAKLVVGDASKQNWWDGVLFDRILADLPCTASGIVRRHPDIRWLRRPADSRQLAKQSSAILDNLWQLLKPSGKLLLVTCSVWPEESVQQADAFAARHKAIRLDAPGQLLPLASTDRDQDGLFYALFQKASV